MHEFTFLKPTITFIVGGPGVGKTTLVDSLFPKFKDSLIIRQDNISGPFLMTPDKSCGAFNINWYKLNGERHPIDGEHYRDNVGLQVYRAMLELATDNLAFGINPFVEGNYLNHIKRGYFQNIVQPFLRERLISENRDYKTKIILCYADKETIAKRIINRNAPRDAQKITSPQAMQEYLDSMGWVPQEINELDHLKIDGSADKERNAKISLEYLLS